VGKDCRTVEEKDCKTVEEKDCKTVEELLRYMKTFHVLFFYCSYNAYNNTKIQMNLCLEGTVLLSMF
jgi:hypothetical protein